MTRVAHSEREAVEATPRRSMTLARKRRIHARCGGRCGCGVELPVTGKGVTYDHWNPIWFGTPDEDAEVEIKCDACNKPKTAKDQRDIAHTKRLIRKADPETRKAPTMRSRRFEKPKFKRAWPKRAMR